MRSIIPKPLCEEFKKGQFVFDATTAIDGDFEKSQAKLVSLLAKCNVQIKTKKGGNIVFQNDPSLAVEEYFLDVEEGKIIITASAEAGAFYAVQSLRQLAEMDIADGGDKIACPCCIIKDKPRFKHRAFMLDVCRHFFDKDTVKEFLEMMALLKMNVFHWHLSEDQGWRIEIKKYPLLTTKGTIRKSTSTNVLNYASNGEARTNQPYGEGKFFTQDDIKEIVAYAQELHIDIIPEIDMPGHMMAAIACYPELSCEGKDVDVSARWGVMDTIGCVGGDKFLPFVKDVIDEVCQLFPYEYFHLGGDEVPKSKWKACPKCQAKIKELGLKNENELQGWFNNQILEYLKTKNKKVIGWNEILDASELSSETVVQWWTKGVAASGVGKWLEKGNKVVISPCPYVYFDHFYSMKDLKKTYSLDLDTVGLSQKFESQTLGFEAPQWTEFVRDIGKLHFNTYPRLQAIAEIGWTAKQNKNFADFECRLKDFSKILDKKNIGYAPRKFYLCRGISNWGRFINAPMNWVRNPNSEYERWLAEKSKK
ncbi:MAG: beta-N-acetylhexosaminidase [Clostridia bacterium]